MSKIARKPIEIPQGVTVTQTDGILTVKGKNGEVTTPVLPFVKAEITENAVKISAESKKKQGRANWGTTAAHLKNAIQGVTQGFSKTLEIQGVGFRASMEGATLVLNVGFSHPIKYPAPEGVTISVEKSTIKVSGANRHAVGEAAAQIRAIKKPEPYKGKGIRYTDEVVRRKAGKKVAGATGA